MYNNRVIYSDIFIYVFTATKHLKVFLSIQLYCIVPIICYSQHVTYVSLFGVEKHPCLYTVQILLTIHSENPVKIYSTACLPAKTIILTVQFTTHPAFWAPCSASS